MSAKSKHTAVAGDAVRKYFEMFGAAVAAAAEAVETVVFWPQLHSKAEWCSHFWASGMAEEGRCEDETKGHC